MAAPRFYRVEGYIIGRKPVGEGDRVITIFTREYGKLRLYAQGIRRISSRRAPHLELFNRVRLLIYRGRMMDMIGEAEMVRSSDEIRSDLTRVSIAYYFCELIDVLLPERQEHDDVFELLSVSLDSIPSYASEKLLIFAGRVSFSLLELLGFLAKGKEPVAAEIVSYIERIAEKRLKTPKFYRLLTRGVRI
ncbi:DNA repair protein RecO [Candidatus Gottesmanbacteria bacterium]|nr:DNA repair protein RecO [Candidatus Gottesmanbacteria bacterium]